MTKLVCVFHKVVHHLPDAEPGTGIGRAHCLVEDENLRISKERPCNRSIHGIGPILSLVILYEINVIDRFPDVGNFISYSGLVKCSHKSAGERVKAGHNKISNAHLKRAFSEAAVLFLRNNQPAKRLQQRLTSRYGKGKALSYWGPLLPGNLEEPFTSC